MHIPDGYLSPSTCAVMAGAAAPFWVRAGQVVRRRLSVRTVPVLSVFSAFCFVIMLFNLPLPGGTSGHAVGGVLLAIVLGPWAAVIGVSTALVVQALLFGDGGITALGANCFNMAIVLPFVGYGVYRALSVHSPQGSRRRVVAAGIAGYVGINAAALLAAVELGLQPLLFRDAGGHPLYAPYPMRTAIIAMMGGHLLVAGPAEAAVTALVVSYLQRSRPDLMLLAQGKEGA